MNGHVGSDENQSDADGHADLHDEIPSKQTAQTPTPAQDDALADNPESLTSSARSNEPASDNNVDDAGNDSVGNNNVGNTANTSNAAHANTASTNNSTTSSINNLPPKPVEGYKKYYRIGEVAAMLDVEPHVLRYWESRFSQVAPVKSPSNQRLYRYEDLVMLKRIQKLVQEQGYSIDGAKLQLEKWLRAEKRLDKLDRQEKLEKLEKSDRADAETEETAVPTATSTTSTTSNNNTSTHVRAENTVAAAHAAQAAAKNTHAATASTARTHVAPVRGFGHAERAQLEELRREVADALSWLRRQR